MSDESPKTYLQDLNVGRQFVSPTYAMDEASITAFAEQFDPQPFHTSDAAARNTFFGGLAASGWHTAAVTMRLLVGSGLDIDGGLIGAGAEVTWPRATRPGDVLQVFTTVQEIVVDPARPDRGIVKLRSETRNQAGKVVQLMVSRIVVPAAPAEAP